MVGSIPNYLRTTTNKYKGLITEKIAEKFLRNEGFFCSNYSHLICLISDFRRSNLGINEYETQKIKNIEDELKQELNDYSSKSPPKTEPRAHVFPRYERLGRKWDEFRKEKLEITHWRLQNLPQEERETIAFLRSCENNFEPIDNYWKWLRRKGHYRPDFVAKKGNDIFIVEVKSQTKGKTALFGDHQKKALLKACDFGFVPILLIVPININIEIEEPQLKVDKEYFK